MTNGYCLTSKELIVDLFCCAGGASAGIHRGLGRSPDIACNHDHEAISLHERNHPTTKHYHCSVWELDPLQATHGQPVGLLHASPDCTYFSRAKGGKPLRSRERRIRSLAWVVVRWAALVKPRVITLENVPEFEHWCPVRRGRPQASKRGSYFRDFVEHLRKLGYSVSWRVLRASNFGARTRRERLFLVARSDGLAPQWPQPKYGIPNRPERSVYDAIDWCSPCPSIFLSKSDALAQFKIRRPLRWSTLNRLADGVERYVLNTDVRDFAPRLIPMGQHSHICCTQVVFIAKHYTGVVGHRCNRPLGTITCKDHHSLVSAACLPEDCVSAELLAQARAVSIWLKTHTSRSCKAAPYARFNWNGVWYILIDVGMRMLQPRELARMQGFDDQYHLPDTKTKATYFIGNSVPPSVMAALSQAQFSSDLLECS